MKTRWMKEAGEKKPQLCGADNIHTISVCFIKICMADKLACQMRWRRQWWLANSMGFSFPKERTETRALTRSRIIHSRFNPSWRGKKVKKKNQRIMETITAPATTKNIYRGGSFSYGFQLAHKFHENNLNCTFSRLIVEQNLI